MDKRWKVRPYQPHDHAACLQLFDGHVPSVFTPQDRIDFEALLGCPDPLERVWGWDTTIYVMEAEGQIMGCGVVFLDCTCKFYATLSWVMVSASRQRQGMGRFLLRHLLGFVAAHPEITLVDLYSDPSNSGFYEKEGFEAVGIWKDHFGPNRSSHHMELSLFDPAIRRRYLIGVADDTT